MAQNCPNCNTPYSEGGVFKESNLAIPTGKVKLVNFSLEEKFTHLCDKCVGKKLYQASAKVQDEINQLLEFLDEKITWFPIFTTSQLPQSVEYKLKAMVTSNVTVGTGIFNEFSQGFSDFFGLVNTGSGMTYKVNKGESMARSIVVKRALQIGANAIIAADIDYGVTGNNAATVNIQGTAIKVENLSQLLDSTELQNAQSFNDSVTRLGVLQGLLRTASI